MKKTEQGFTFIEILVFTSILSFVLIALTTTVVSSLQKTQTTEHRLYATRYAEELMEWLRAEEETSWETFTARDLNNGGGTTYCFNTPLDFQTPDWSTYGTNLTACMYDGIGTPSPTGTALPPRIYKRYAIITAIGPDFRQVNVQIIVEWRDGNRYYSTPLNTIFTNVNET